MDTEHSYFVTIKNNNSFLAMDKNKVVLDKNPYIWEIDIYRDRFTIGSNGRYKQ